jgi:hypothetical protein
MSLFQLLFGHVRSGMNVMILSGLNYKNGQIFGSIILKVLYILFSIEGSVSLFSLKIMGSC